MLPKPSVDGLPQIILTPLKLLDRLAKFIPPPRGDLSKWMRAGLGLKTQPLPALPESTGPAPSGTSAWARLIARVYEVDPLRCPRCGATMRLIAFIVERAVIVRILDPLGEPTAPT